MIEKGEIYLANLSPVIGSEQGGVRPVVVIQNNVGNFFSSTVVAAVTSKETKNKIPTHVEVEFSESGFHKNSIILLEQIRTIDKSRIIKYIGKLNHTSLKKVDEALIKSFGISK